MTHGADDYALVVGINHYPKWANGKKTLKGAVPDAQKFHRWLTSPTGGGLDPANARLVLSTEDPLTPLQHVVDREFEIIRDNSKGKTRRRFYFFFSGHGHSPAMAQGEQALCLANWSLELQGAALHFESYLNAAVGCLNFEEGLFFLDCCRVQEATPLGKSSDLECGNPKLGGKQYITFYATEHYEAGYEAQGDEPHGYFGRALLDTLEKGRIEAADLEKRLGKDVKEFAKADSKKQVARAMRYVDRAIFLGPPLDPAPPGPTDEVAPSEVVLSVTLKTNLSNMAPPGELPPPSPGSITLYRGEQFVASMRGAFKMSVPIGVYAIHVTHGEAVEVHRVDLQSDTEVRYELPRRNSAAPLSSTLDKREIFTDPIVAASSRLTDSGEPLFPQAVFVAHRKKGMPVDGDFNGQLTLEGSASFRWIADSRMLIGAEPGTYTLRYRGPDAGALCLAVPVVTGWDTQIFFVEDDGRPVLERASVFMRPAGRGFDPADALIDAYEQALADLVSGGPGPDRSTLDMLLYGKFKNPLFGLVGAHFLIRELRLARQISDDRRAMLDIVIGNMGGLLGENNADVIALKLLRAKLLKQTPEATPYDGAPLLRASLLALIDATADLPPSSIAHLDAVALGALAYSPWCCWQEAESTIELWSSESLETGVRNHDLLMPLGPRIGAIEKILKEENYTVFTTDEGVMRRLQAQGELRLGVSDHISLARLARVPEWVVDEMKAEIQRSERTGDPVDLAKVVRRLTLPLGILHQALRVAHQEVTQTTKSTNVPEEKRYLRGAAG